MADLHAFQLATSLHPDVRPRLVEDWRVDGLMIALAEAAGAGEQNYDPWSCVLDPPEAGITGCMPFPGGRVVVQTFLDPCRVVVDVLSDRHVDHAEVASLVERHLGLLCGTVTRGFVQVG